MADARSPSAAFVPSAFAEATVPAAFAEAAATRPAADDPVPAWLPDASVPAAASGFPVPDADTADRDGVHDSVVRRTARRRDLLAYISVPLVTLFVGPALTVVWSLLILGTSGTAPSVCEPVRASNGCEELTWELIRQHVLAFLALWSLLWTLPWWRGLRTTRVLLALAVTAVLVVLPVRMAG